MKNLGIIAAATLLAACSGSERSCSVEIPGGEIQVRMEDGTYKVEVPDGPATVILKDCGLRSCQATTAIRTREGGGFGYQRLTGECKA